MRLEAHITEGPIDLLEPRLLCHNLSSARLITIEACAIEIDSVPSSTLWQAALVSILTSAAPLVAPLSSLEQPHSLHISIPVHKRQQ